MIHRLIKVTSSTLTFSRPNLLARKDKNLGCCAGKLYDWSKQICCDNKEVANQNLKYSISCCAEKSYDRRSKTCCDNKVYDGKKLCCGDKVDYAES